ncbi:Fe(3+)-hydroxamate ABC transporter permease FhuB [Paraburkholderia sp. J12]|uniref:Fe(3+)-hydroxamate ABC transporter permease FhuB n=1 Tax=Paraburkholderia sp. J12 TaxID=2805432 RepID=UPI002ABDB42F|nr:Fe(3+)-hydroxamate ABC transporter permease FhuB [Paraburkholderia sp. J12]
MRRLADEAAIAATRPACSSDRRPWRLAAWLALFAALLAMHTLSRHLAPSQWFDANPAAPAVALQRLVVQYAWLPRLVVSLVAGGALALAGTLFQQVLRNPLAEPMTLGVSAGASLTMTVAAIWAPALFASQRFGIAFAGAALAMLVTLSLTWRKGFAPVPVVLAGMIVNLYCGAVGVILTIAHERTLIAVFIWGGGSLSQNGWDSVLWLLPRVAAGVLCAVLLVRPLTLFALPDAGARQLGLSLACVRPLTLAVAVALGAFVTSAVGVIGFVGLAGPVLARLAGARRLRDQLLWAPLTGAALLALTDQAVQCLPGMGGDLLPTGAATALLGGPLLLWLLRRLPVNGGSSVGALLSEPAIARRRLGTVAPLLLVMLELAVLVSLCFSNTTQGWHWSGADELSSVAFWRVPRLVASASAGVMLAIAGTVLQRTSGNPMASPELLGVSGGAMLGLFCATLAWAAPSATGLLGASLAGSLLGLAAMMLFARRSRFAPASMLLVGVALTGLSQSVIALATASGGSYAFLLRSLTLGSTYLIGPGIASAAAVWAVASAVAAGVCGRWLTILPLGEGVAGALGVGAGRARFLLMLVAAMATAGATIVVGPLSFVGLLAPHLARLLGFPRARAQLLVAALIGALVMVLADWAGRNLIFPQQMPAGLLAAMIGGPYLLWLLRR